MRDSQDRSRAVVPPAAVLFDLDGTLVDTSMVWRVAYLAVAERRGRRLPEDWWAMVAGRSIEASVDVFVDDGDRLDGTDRWELAAELVAQAERVLPSVDLEWLPGAGQLLADVQAHGVPTALVTSTWHDLAVRVLDTLGSTVPVVVGGDEVTEGKPAPDIYLLAAQQLGVDPTRCLAFEDSPTGVASAEAAGTHVWVVPSGSSVATGPRRTVVASLEGLSYPLLAHVWR